MINHDDIASDNVEFIAESGGNGTDNEKTTETQIAADYSEDDIKTLDWKEHIRRRPGLYIGKLGDGSNYDDGIYVLIKEVLGKIRKTFSCFCSG